MTKITIQNRIAFQISRLFLLAVICALFNKPFIFVPALILMTANVLHLFFLLKRKDVWRKVFTAINLYVNVYLIGLMMIDNIPNLPRFIERTHRTFLGIDAAVVLWGIFWISFLALEIANRSMRKKRAVRSTEKAGVKK